MSANIQPTFIKIEKSTINGAEINSVNARELHSQLEVKKAFTTWIAVALENAGAIENEDFLKLKYSLEGSGYQIDYILTVDIAKHIAMMSKVPKSKIIRDYFIQIEKQFHQQVKPLTTSEQIVLLAQGHQEIEQRLSSTENKINYLENKSPIVYNQIKVLEDKRKSRTNQLVGYNPNCDKSKANYSRTIRALTKKYKNTFGVARYADLPKEKYNDALKWVSNVEMVDLI